MKCELPSSNVQIFKGAVKVIIAERLDDKTRVGSRLTSVDANATRGDSLTE